MTEEKLKEQCPRCGGTIGKGGPEPTCSCASPKEWIRRSLTLTREFEKEIDVDKDKFPLKRYKPLSLIGSGGNGTVYCCRDRVLRKKVAIKVISDASSKQLVAFQKEARATSKLVHPNIVAVLDFGVVEGGTPYMVMELFEGAALSHAIRSQGPLQIQTALAVFSRVCDGLAEAHRLGVFHRDINNSNILVSDLDSENPAVRIIDFGVARLKQDQDATSGTQGVTLVGTPHYMSADQAAGKKFDERSEIYSVGCALFESLTGVPPYSGDSALEIINQHATAPVPTLAEKNPSTYFPNELESVIASCLAKDPKRRPQSMSDLGSALNNLMITMTLSHPTMRLELPARKKNRQKAIVMMVIVSSILVGILYVYAISHKKAAVHKVAVVADGMRQQDDYQSKWQRVKLDENMTAVVAEDGVVDSDLNAITKLNVPGVILKRSRITNSGLHKMRDMPLRYLNLEQTPIDDSAIPHIAKFKEMKFLGLSETGVTDDGITRLSGLRAITGLELDGVDRITDKGLASIVEQWPDMQNLNLANTSVTKQGILELEKLPNLRSLALARLLLSDDAMRVVLSLSKLEVLSLIEVEFAPEFLEQIPKMPSLRLLSIGCLPGVDDKGYAELREKMKGGRCELRMNYDPNTTLPTMQPLMELIDAEGKNEEE